MRAHFYMLKHKTCLDDEPFYWIEITLDLIPAWIRGEGMPAILLIDSYLYT